MILGLILPFTWLLRRKPVLLLSYGGSTKFIALWMTQGMRVLLQTRSNPGDKVRDFQSPEEKNIFCRLSTLSGPVSSAHEWKGEDGRAGKDC